MAQEDALADAALRCFPTGFYKNEQTTRIAERMYCLRTHQGYLFAEVRADHVTLRWNDHFGQGHALDVHNGHYPTILDQRAETLPDEALAWARAHPIGA